MWTLTLADGSTWEAFEFGITSDKTILRIGLNTKSAEKALAVFTDPRKTEHIKGTDKFRNKEFYGYIYLDSMFRDEEGRCTLRLSKEVIS